MMSNPISRGLGTACALVAVLGPVVACSSGASTSERSATTVAADASTTAAAGASTSVSPSPGAATTVAPESWELRSDGFGPFYFDDFPDYVIPAVTAQLGAPARNDLVLYEDRSDFAALGVYTSFDGPYFYSLPYLVGRTTCWTGEFCVEFGGGSEDQLAFIGWSYTGLPGLMASSFNLTIGSQWSEFPGMSVFATCYTTGGGTLEGIDLQLETAAPWDWLVSDGVGGFVENLPDREFTRVSQMSAGQIPSPNLGDC